MHKCVGRRKRRFNYCGGVTPFARRKRMIEFQRWAVIFGPPER
jgi:hypothetical protein